MCAYENQFSIIFCCLNSHNFASWVLNCSSNFVNFDVNSNYVYFDRSYLSQIYYLPFSHCYLRYRLFFYPYTSKKPFDKATSVRWRIDAKNPLHSLLLYNFTQTIHNPQAFKYVFDIYVCITKINFFECKIVGLHHSRPLRKINKYTQLSMQVRFALENKKTPYMVL